MSKKIINKACGSCAFRVGTKEKHVFFCQMWMLKYSKTDVCQKHIFKEDSFYSSLNDKDKLSFLLIEKNDFWGQLTDTSQAVLDSKINLIGKK